MNEIKEILQKYCVSDIRTCYSYNLDLEKDLERYIKENYCKKSDIIPLLKSEFSNYVIVESLKDLIEGE